MKLTKYFDVINVHPFFGPKVIESFDSKEKAENYLSELDAETDSYMFIVEAWTNNEYLNKYRK